MGDKRIKLYSPAVTQTSSIIEESFIQQSLATASGKAEKGKPLCRIDYGLCFNADHIESYTIEVKSPHSYFEYWESIVLLGTC